MLRMLRPSRSSRQTIRVSPSRRYRMHSVKPGRSSRAPDMTSWKILPAPAAVSASVCCSRVWPMVDTRAYPITVEAVVDAEAVLTPSVYRQVLRRSVSEQSTIGTYFRDSHVVGKHNRVDGTQACPGTDRISVQVHKLVRTGRAGERGRRARVRSSCRQAPRRRSRTPSAKGSGQFAPGLRVEAREFVKQPRPRYLVVRHAPPPSIRVMVPV